MILLDTHIWIPWSAGDYQRFSANSLKRIKESQQVAISIISCWELAMLVAKGRLKLSMDVLDWINKALSSPKLALLDLNQEISVLSTRLPGDFHGDPADRIIVATALIHNIELVTKDRLIRKWGHVKIIS